jgi:Icc protein
MEPVRFSQVTDTHIGPTPEFAINGERTHERARATIEALNRHTGTVDFVMHTGDIVADPNPDSSRHVVDIFAGLKLPARFIPGNHDSAEATRELLVGAPVRWFPATEGRMPYSFELKGHTFLALDALPSEPFWGAVLPKDQLEMVRGLIASGVQSLVVFIHYPVQPVGVQWIDEKMLLWNGDELHAVLRSAPPGIVKGVFSGHVHRPITTLVDGILYSSAASAFNQFLAFPGQTQPDSAPGEQQGYATVEINRTGCSVVHHRFMSGARSDIASPPQ